MVFLIVLTAVIGFSIEDVALEEGIVLVAVGLLFVKLLRSSRSGVLKKSEIDAMKMEVIMKKSFIYRLWHQNTRKLESIREGNNYMRIAKDYNLL